MRVRFARTGLENRSDLFSKFRHQGVEKLKVGVPSRAKDGAARS